MKALTKHIVETSDKIILRYCLEYDNALIEALRDYGLNHVSNHAIRNENFFFGLFIVDSYLSKLKCDIETRSQTFNTLIANYYSRIVSDNPGAMDVIVNNRMEQYSNAFNLSAPANIEQIADIHCKLVHLAHNGKSNDSYIHGQSRIETDLILFSLIRKVDNVISARLIDALVDIKEALTVSAIQSHVSSEKTLNAYFCHDGLPQILFRSKEKVVNQFFAEPEITIRKLWQFCAENMKTEVEKVLYASIHEKPKLRIVLINLPKPQRYTDCYYSAIVFHYEKRLLSTRILRFAYYTLEFGIDLERHREVQFMCGWTDEKTHVNYGQLDDNTTSRFLEEIFAREAT